MYIIFFIDKIMKALQALRPQDCQLEIRRKNIYVRQNNSVPRIQIVAFPSQLENAKRKIQAKLHINHNRFVDYQIDKNREEKGGELKKVLANGTGRMHKIRMSRMSHRTKSHSDQQESLYGKSLQKMRGRKERSEFQRSLREIGAQKYICMKKADSEHSVGRNRCHTQNSQKC